MGTTFACLKGNMGSTEYYILKMKAGILINTVGFASQIAEWDTMDIDEKIQRELDEKRVVSDIVPYLVQDPDRFFGSIIVDIYRGWENVVFESLNDVAKVPKAYQNQLDDLGFVHLPDNQSLIALDGQHRLLALNVAIKGYRGLTGSKISDDMKEQLKPNPDLVEDDLTVILVPHTDTVKIRKIFNKINRYAKGTSRGDNIITDEDDIHAIIARRLMKVDEVLSPINGQHVVNWTSNTLSPRSKHLTTISAIYSISEELIGKFDKKQRPDEAVIDEKTEEIGEYWGALLGGLNIYKKYVEVLEGKDKSTDIPKLRESNLMLKPVTQMAVAIGYSIARRKGVSLTDFVSRLNQISWDYNDPMWEQVLVIAGTNKVITNKQAINNSGRLIAYLVAGTQYSTAEKDSLLESIHGNNPKYVLPQPLA